MAKSKVKGDLPPRTKPKPELVSVDAAFTTAADPSPSGDDVLPSVESELSSRLAGLEKDHAEVTAQIQGFRRRLRDGQIRACDTHSALDPAEIKFCKSNIADLHIRLTAIQSEISRVGKALRAARAQAPAAARVLESRKVITTRDGESRLVPRRDSAHHSVLVLESFLRISQQELPQEQFEQLMREAIALSKDVRKMSEPPKDKTPPRRG
jgi:hypothetical protein